MVWSQGLLVHFDVSVGKSINPYNTGVEGSSELEKQCAVHLRFVFKSLEFAGLQLTFQYMIEIKFL